MMLNILSKMQQKLSLNEAQVKELQVLQDRFKEQMQNYVDAKTNMSIAACETVGKMKALLTTEQKEQLKAMMHQETRMNSEKENRLQNSNGMINYCNFSKM